MPEQQETTIVQAEIRSEETATDDVTMEAQPRTPEAPRDEPAVITDATAAAPIEPITLGSTIASSLQQVTSHEPILNQPMTLLICLAPKTNSNIFTGL